MTTLLVLFLLCPVQAKTQDPKKPAVNKWAVEWRVRGELAYDNNVWLLDGGQQERMHDDRPGDDINGRFDHMETPYDIIFTPGLRFGAKGPSPLGRRAEVWAGLDSPYYFENPRKSHLLAAFGLGQSIGNNGRLELVVEYLPKYFRKNYLVDATDFVGNNNAFERSYKEANYSELELHLEYRHDLIKRTPQKSFGMEAALELGYRDRSYNSPFSGRDEEAPAISLGFKFEHGPKFRWGIRYAYEDIESPETSEVMLLNEFVYGVPVNGDFLVDDDDARRFDVVDRSQSEHSIELQVGYEITPALEAEIAYEHLIREYHSDNMFDADNFEREDSRDEVRLGLRYKFAKNWDARLGYEWRQHNTQRTFDTTDSTESVDYKRNIFYLNVTLHW